MQKYIGYEVYSTRNGARGVVINQDSLTITINIDGVQKSYTHNTFNRWWKVVPRENDEEDPEPEQEEFEPTNETEYDERGLPLGQIGVGIQLRNKFIQLVTDLGIDEVTIFHNAKEKTDIIKYNGVNVFECKYASRRFHVLAHPQSLTPMNRKKVTLTHPVEWGWSLRSKFIFTALTQWPLMKSIINDGMFYRAHKDDL